MGIAAVYESLAMSESGHENNAELFWMWFGDVQEGFRNLSSEGDRDVLLKWFQGILHRYDDKLYFEISEPLEDGSNELIITAAGVRSKFPRVKALIAAAPELPKWKIIAFKPAQGFDFIHEYGDLRIDPKELWFLPLTAKSDPSVLGLRVGLPDFDDTAEDEIKNAIWIILDTGLGEVICAERIRHLEVVRLPEEPETKGFIELTELPSYLEWITKQNGEQGSGANS